MRNEEDDRVVEETIGPEGDTIKVFPHHHKHEGHHAHHAPELHDETVGPEGDTIKVLPHLRKHEGPHVTEHHEETIGPEGDTIKVFPHTQAHEGAHGQEHQDLSGHVRTDPEKRHGDALLEGNGSRQGSADLDPDRRF